ncbi:hypothetical protein FRB99_002228 [Tulasnella sp. 403]|nr:hypothetical protein FRB99_002228 [Tulasnella sp. 403]
MLASPRPSSPTASEPSDHRRHLTGGAEPPSPTSLALASLNMTRDDLARHTDQMRCFLNTAAPSLHVLSHEARQHRSTETDNVSSRFSSPSSAVMVKSETVDPGMMGVSSTTSSRPSMDAVLERNEKRRKDSRRDRRQSGMLSDASNPPGTGADSPSTTATTPSNLVLSPPARTPTTDPLDASRPSSACSSLAYQQVGTFLAWLCTRRMPLLILLYFLVPFIFHLVFCAPPRSGIAHQDVFYSRPASVAPSSSLSHPSLRRSQSTSSQFSVPRGDDVGDHASEELSASADAILGFDQQQPQLQQKHRTITDYASRAGSSFSTHSASVTAAYDTTTAPTNQTSMTPSKRNDNFNTPLPPLQLALPCSSSILPSSSPVYPYRSSSPAGPRTPHRPHHLKPLLASAPSRPPNAVASSSPAPMPVSSPPADGSPTSSSPLPFRLPPGPRLTSKPHYSYAALIGQALMSSPTKRLSLNQIYTWISLAYPYFKRGEAGWQNSIRHNLSLNGCFIKIKREDGEKGKGSWWAIREGDEPCFAGGGFQRQGRANGRKRKGKADKDQDIKMQDVEDDGTGDGLEDDGASPKKKKKIAVNTAPRDPASSIPRTAPGYSRSNSTSTTATSVHTHASSTSYDSTSSYAANGYGLPVFYPNPYNGASLPYVTGLPPLRVRTPSDLSRPRQSAHASPRSDVSARGQQTAEQALQRSSLRQPTSTHVRTHASAGYPLRPAAYGIPSSPLAGKRAPSSATTEDEAEAESDDEDREEASQTSLSAHVLADRTDPDSAKEGDDELMTEDDNEAVPHQPSFAQPAPLRLDAPFTLNGGSSASSTAQGSSTRDSMSSTLSTSSEPPSLQPGFTFVPTSKDSESKSTTKVDSDDVNESEDRGRHALRVSDEDPMHKFFSSSPIPHSHSRTRAPSSRLPSARPGANASGGTDLLSRVLESKALKRSGHGHQSSNSGSSTSNFQFPRPTTPVKDLRPSTPPPFRYKLDKPGRQDGDDDDKLLKNMDPSVAAAVTALTSLSPMRTPVSHAAFHMSPAPPPSSDLTHYKHSLGPPTSPFRTPARSSTTGGGRAFEFYDFLNDGGASGGNFADDMDKAFGGGSGSARAMPSLLGPGGLPRTPATPITGGLFGSASLYQSPSLPSPGWRRY